MIARTGGVYALLCGAYLLFFGYNDSITGACVKTLPALLLALASARLLRGAWRAHYVVALLCSALGDLLLGLNGVYGGLFTAGLASFLLAQLAYAGVFWRHRAAARWRRALAAASLLPLALVAWQVLPATGELAPPVAAYMLAIGAMLGGAALADRPLLLFAGAALFVISDATIAWNRFLAPLPHAGLLIMTTYYAAQWLLWHGAPGTPRSDRR